MTNLTNIIETIVKSENNLNAVAKENFLTYVNNFVADKKEQKSLKIALLDQCKHLTEKTINNRFGMLNSALKLNVDASKFVSFYSLEKQLKEVKKGNSKVLKSGKNKGAITVDKKGTDANIEQKEVIQAVNENELVQLMASAEFKSFKAYFETQEFKLATVLKALKA